MRRIRFTWRWPFVRLLPPPRSTLLVVRLARMYRIHPDMGHGECALCREQVGIFPAGMVFLRSYPGRVDVVCSDCQARDARARNGRRPPRHGAAMASG
jgi:hypothetical protein